MNNYIDLKVTTYLNQFSQNSWVFDKIIKVLSENGLLKGGVLAVIIWWAWFKSEDRHSLNREHIVLTLFSCIIAVALARALALTLPFRLRPLHDESLNLLLTYDINKGLLDGWSSFPSDHAVLFFALSTGLLITFRKVGVFAFFYSTLFVAFPRIYLGLHYLTDIIAGAIIGITITLLANSYFVKSNNIKYIVDLSYSKPYFFYPVFFLFTYQIADMFNDTADLIGGVFKLTQRIIA